MMTHGVCSCVCASLFGRPSPWHHSIKGHTFSCSFAYNQTLKLVTSVYSGNTRPSCFLIQHIMCCKRKLQVVWSPVPDSGPLLIPHLQYGNINVDRALYQWLSLAGCPGSYTHHHFPRSRVHTKGNKTAKKREAELTGWRKWQIRRWGGIRLTVRCRHQRLKLLGFGRGLGPGASSHGNLRSSSCPVVRIRTSKTVNKIIHPLYNPCFIYSLSSWCFKM